MMDPQATTDRDEIPVSIRLRHLPADAAVPLAELARLLGTRVHSSILLLLALPDAIPLPLPSASAVLGLPMLVISAHLELHGEDGELPEWLGRRLLSQRIIGLFRTRLADLLAHGEQVSRPRWTLLAGRERFVGVVCVVLSLALLLPLPFFNTPPALCLALLAWGLLRRDGLIVAVGLAGSLAVALVLLLGSVGLISTVAWWLPVGPDPG